MEALPEALLVGCLLLSVPSWLAANVSASVELVVAVLFREPLLGCKVPFGSAGAAEAEGAPALDAELLLQPRIKDGPCTSISSI